MPLAGEDQNGPSLVIPMAAAVAARKSAKVSIVSEIACVRRSAARKNTKKACASLRMVEVGTK